MTLEWHWRTFISIEATLKSVAASTTGAYLYNQTLGPPVSSLHASRQRRRDVKTRNR